MPLLDALREQGGKATPADVYRGMAVAIGLSGDEQCATVETTAGSTRVFDRNVRWARQKAKLLGLVSSPKRNLWELTESGSSALLNAKPGVVITVFETEGGVALWGESQAALGTLSSGSVNLIVTSPPYPLLKRKGYANEHGAEKHVEWLMDQARDWKRILADDGSLMLNLGDVFTPGLPVMSLYQERLILRMVDELGFNLAQKLLWHNQSKMPSPAEWVTVRRIRLTPASENLWWLSKSAFPKANNRNVLRPYSASMQAMIKAGGNKAAIRPSGHQIKSGAFGRDNGGSIAHNVLTFSNTSSNNSYQKYCAEKGLPKHPARFPEELAEFCVKLCTDKGDLCVDGFGGSLTMAAVCEKLGRRWVSSDKSLAYLRGGLGRFPGALGLKDHLSWADQAVRPLVA